MAFITNRKFLTGWPYAGLRMMLRERFDRIEVIDLRGDVRRGERAGVGADQGVFNIQVGTAITLAIADGSRASGEAARVFYHDCWTEGLFSRRAKLEWLVAGANEGTRPNAIDVNRDLLEDMRPRPFQNGEWINIREAFVFFKSGMKSGNDEVFTSPSRSRLSGQLAPLLENRADPTYDTSLETFYSYRPLDRRWFFNDLRLLDRPGPKMQRVWGSQNVGLYALPSGTGGGPAVWCHGLLPDYHGFRGSYGGYAFPLHDRRPTVNATNISSALLSSLSSAYGEAARAADVFDAILCLLSAESYTLRFAEDLEDVFPHVPFPARHEVFQEAVQIGQRIRAIETFERAPGEALGRPGFVRLETQPRGALGSVEFTDGAITLCADRSGRIVGLPESVWSFSVSGYRVLARWLDGRVGLPIDINFINELRDICGRIAELIDLFAQADTVLEATLRETLTREALGFTPGGQDANDGTD